MNPKLFLVLTAACFVAIAFASEEEESRPGKPSKQRYGGKDDSDSDEYDTAPKYKFAYRVTAKDPVKYSYGYGDDDSDSGENKGAAGDDSGERRTSEFGHMEMRDGDRTDGKYFVQLPDGRLQTVTYYVDGYSGYVAKVSYDGEGSGDDSGEKDGRGAAGSGAGQGAEGGDDSGESSRKKAKHGRKYRG
jgi:hypothetical protein